MARTDTKKAAEEAERVAILQGTSYEIPPREREIKKAHNRIILREYTLIRSQGLWKYKLCCGIINVVLTLAQNHNKIGGRNMLQIPDSKKRNLCFSQRITDAMGKIFDHPLTLVEAPMGYGKTTAVREHVMLTDANLLWQNVYDDSKTVFWSGFCLLFKELDNKRTNNLAQLGFPDDSVSLRAALTLIKDIVLSKPTVIVIDDFHHVDTQETTRFITFLTINEIANLHIVLISRFFEFFSSEELSMKNHLYHIKKESFKFSQKEIIAYYALCGISITASEADDLYNLTEGWIGALYLLMLNYKESGSLLTSVSIYKLVEQAVYDPFPDTIKKFLLSMSIYNSFTLEQAVYMMPDADIMEIINEVTGINAFVTLDFIQKTYYIHSIFKNFLSDKLGAMQEPFQTELYKKAAGWYLQIGDYLMSMRYSYLGGDFDTLLGALELDKGQSINGEHKGALIKYFDACPLEEKIKHPYAVLVNARRMFIFNEISLFKKNCEEFMTIYQIIKIEDADYKDSLLGEYELLMSFAEYNDIEKMAKRHKSAYELLRGTSLILDKQSSWTYGAPSVLYLFYRKSGELFKEVQTMQEVMPYYYQITGNHGKGAEEIMSAERFYYIGDFQSAEITMHKAYQATEETSDIMLCTIFLNLRLSFMKGDFTNILNLFKKLHDNIFEKKWQMLIHTIDTCEAYIFSCLHMNKKVEPWIKSGEFQSTRLLFPSLAYLNIVYGKVLLENGEYVKLIGRAEQFLSIASVYPNVLAQIYTHIYIAAANAQISRAGDALAALKQALNIAIPDKVYMPFVENGDMIKPLLEELQAQNMYADGLIKILTLYNQYHKAAEHIIKEYSTQGKTALTKRENEIAYLAAQGLSNKEIGKRLYISENTVKTHLKSVFRKLGINSRSLLKQEFDI